MAWPTSERPTCRTRLGKRNALLVVWWMFGGPNYTLAGRRASAASAEERIRVLRGDTLPPYFAGVDIMRQYLLESEEESAGPRRLALGVLDLDDARDVAGAELRKRGEQFQEGGLGEDLADRFLDSIP